MLCVFYLTAICGALAYENGKYMAGEKEKKLRPTEMLMLTCMPKHKNYNHILAGWVCAFDWDLRLGGWTWTWTRSWSWTCTCTWLGLV